METKSTNEVKGDYDRVSASECLGSLIELHGIVMEDDLFVIPDADGTAVLYNDGKIRFDEIADIAPQRLSVLPFPYRTAQDVHIHAWRVGFNL